MSAKPKLFRYDQGLVGLTLALSLFGMVMVFSASSGMSENRFGSPYLFFRKQLLWDAIGVLMLLITMRIDYHAWQRWALPLVMRLGGLARGGAGRGARGERRAALDSFGTGHVSTVGIGQAVADPLGRELLGPPS